jgi:hypothetical protein
MIGKLTALKIERIKKPGTYGDGGGLYAQASGPATGSWVFKYTDADGRRREMGLGSFDTYGLAKARELAHECRKLVAEGRDPIEERKVARLGKKLEAARAMTFAASAERYIASHKAGWRNRKHAAQWPSTLKTYAYPIFGALPVQAIDTAPVGGLDLRASDVSQRHFA